VKKSRDFDTMYSTAHALRRRVLSHVIAHNGGYLSQALSSAEILSALYMRIMKLDPLDTPLIPEPFHGVPSQSNSAYTTGAAFNGKKSPDNDRFILSPVHYALALYALLVENGRMAESGLDDFNKDGSSVEMIGAEHSPGMEVTGGSLGQALSQAIGIALGRRIKGEQGRVWVFMSDGEFQIGQTWEALQFASYHKLGNLGIYVDCNGQQCDGRTESVMSIDPLDSRCEAFGAHVHSVDGHNVRELIAPSEEPSRGKPLVVMAFTDPCRGVEILRKRAPKLHYLRFASPEEKSEYEKVLASWEGV
jgi:transketolase